jgi:uncharacterized protein
MSRARFLLTAFLAVAVFRSVVAQDERIPWIHKLDDATFAKAAAEKKLILLDLEAVWCHWCHVMRNTTYRDPNVESAILANFIPVRIDQDSRPDLSARYDDYGWPATIVLDGKGTDLVKRSGFISPSKMVAMLREVVSNPIAHEDERDTGPEASGNSSLSTEQRKTFNDFLDSRLDREQGGLLSGHRFLGAEWPEAVLRAALGGNAEYAEFIKATLKSGLKLHDPVWGGVYQYSTDFGWDVPHFEKIVSAQANNIRIYSFAASAFKDPALLNAAQGVRRYITAFLTSPEGAFYTSQDADLIQGEHSATYFSLNDVERRKLGIPKVDTHVYSNENGTIITAYTQLYAASGDKGVLEEAIRAAKWILANRSLKGGGFRHDHVDVGGPYLKDTLAMATALLGLYSVTGDREWLEHAIRASEFIRNNFIESGKPGYLSFSPQTAGVLKPNRLRDENVLAARFLNLLGHYSGNGGLRSEALRAMEWLTSPTILSQSKFQPGLLMADLELSSVPLHITIVGRKDDAKAQALFNAALQYPSTYKRVDWWDKREGPMPNPDVQYPQLERAAAFICTASTCSFPIFEPEAVARVIDKQNTK